MSDSFVKISQITKDFNMGQTIVRALAGVDLVLEPNSFTILMGPSGSGKSTLLYLLGGLDRATSGHIEINGQLLDDLDENALAIYRRKTVGFIFQSFNLVSSMTALQNVSFPMRFNHTTKRQRTQRAVEVLKQVGLEDRMAHRPTELSGGQQQRVAIARALINDPLLILADEPTGNLDTSSGANIMQLLSELHRTGHSVLVVTHDSRMKQFATHHYYLLDGRIVTEEEYNAASILLTTKGLIS
ncbi:MAG: macrolide ABC transporter ATP-binding protein [Chloroflexi bacterium RBG_16_47_49]|nr:MAG: macrolide ABC transporter ATP-binding protein [Chloroflexi bacterium RBG_16_47_49]